MVCDHSSLRLDLDGAVVCTLCKRCISVAPATHRIEPWSPRDVSHDDPEDEVW